MIDFENSRVFKLSPVKLDKVNKHVPEFLIEGEQIIGVFKTIRDQLVFTNKRIIAINVQGVTGKKTDYTTIPFSKIQTYSIETSGVLDLDCELEVYVSSIGQIRFEIRGSFDIVAFNKILSSYVLK